VELLEERRQVARICRRMRTDGLVAVSPSGLDYDEMTPEVVGVHRLDGEPVDAPLRPTTELPMHLAVYARTDARAVVHTHSTAATALSTLVDEVPPIHYLIAMFGGPVRVASYATYGTPELAAAMVAALDGRTACLLANHGAITCAATPARAYEQAVYLEWICEVVLRASGGAPRLLPPEEIERVRRKLADYGPRRAGEAPG
jgi:L-fuculose-phosphate aldolase